MKKYKFLILIIFAHLIIPAFSCNKDNPSSNTATTFVGKWKYVSHIEKENGVTLGTPYIGKPEDYFDFKATSVLEIFSNGQKFSTTYSISGNKVTIVNSDVNMIFEIIFNSNKCTLYNQDLVQHYEGIFVLQK
jgi:hypothetical protein